MKAFKGYFFKNSGLALFIMLLPTYSNANFSIFSNIKTVRTNKITSSDAKIFPNSIQRSNEAAIEIKNLNVKRAGTSEIVSLGERINSVKLKFGKPDKVTYEYWEIDEITATVLNYKGCKLNFIHNKLNSYTVTSPDFEVGNPNGPFFSVNQKFDRLKDYVNNYHPKEHYASADITIKGIFNDQYVYIQFENRIKGALISNISIREY